MSKETGDKAMHLANPFRAQHKRGNEDTLKYCAWEVLKDHPHGLEISLLAKEIQERRLRDLSKMKNAAGQISSELVRANKAFCQSPEQKLWWIRPLAPSKFAEATVSSSSMDAERPAGQQLAGHRVAVWWKGEKRYFEGVIDSFDAATDLYTVIYDDGDTDDGLELRRYEVAMKNERIDVVTVFEHNLDDVDDGASSQPKGTVTSKEDASDWTYSTTQAACSADSRTGAELSDVTPRKGSKRLREGKSKTGGRTDSQKERRKLRTTTGRVTRSLNREESRDVGTPGSEVSGPDRGIVNLKRKNEVSDEGKDNKKTRVGEETVDLPATDGQISAVVGSGQRLEKKLLQGAHTEMPRTVPLPMGSAAVTASAGRDFTVNKAEPEQTDQLALELAPSTEMEIDQPVCEKKDPESVDAIKAEDVAAEQPRVRKVERINVLDLTRQLQPPEDKRPDLKNLTDVGELMSLSELSNQLKMLPDSDWDGEEVTSNPDKAAAASKQPWASKRPCLDQAVATLEVTATNKMPQVAGERLVTAKPGIRTAAVITDSFVGHRSVQPVTPQSQRPQTMREHRRVADAAVYGDIRMMQRGRDLLSPSILSKHQTGLNLSRAAHPSSAVVSMMGRHGLAASPARVMSVRTDERLGGYGMQSDLSRKSEIQISEIRELGKVSGDSTARNNEAASQSLAFDATTYPTRTTNNQATARREPWKDRFSVAEGR